MAIAKITIKDLGKDDQEFSIQVECYPRITDKQIEDGNITLAQYIALKVVEFVNNGLEDVPSEFVVDITANGKKRTDLH